MRNEPSAEAATKSCVREWLQLAAHPATVRRACLTALIVGLVLVAINDGPAILSGQLTRTRHPNVPDGAGALCGFHRVQRIHAAGIGETELRYCFL